jgi:hypothetical protein
VTDRAGSYTLLGVPPGSYVVRVTQTPRPAQTNMATTIIQTSSGGGSMVVSSTGVAGPLPPVSNDPTLWAAVPLPVGRVDISGVAITLQTGVRVTGRVAFEGSAEKPAADALSRIAIIMESADGANPRGGFVSPGRVEASGEFKTAGLPGGKYILRVTPPAGWTLESAMVQGRDISDVPVDLEAADVAGVVITFTDRPTELSGTVQGSQGDEANATVMVFPTDVASWSNNGINPRRMRSTRVSQGGSYKLSGLPAGSYYVVALPDEFASDWQEANFLASLAAGAAQATLADGQKKTQDVRLTRPK